MEITVNIVLKNKKTFEIVMGKATYDFFKLDMNDNNKKFVFIDDIIYINKEEISYIDISKGVKE